MRFDRDGKYYERYTKIDQSMSLFGKFLDEEDIIAQYIIPKIPQ